MIQFERPAAIFLAAAPPALALVRAYRRRMGAEILDVPELPRARATWRTRIAFLPGLLSALGFVAASLALAGPARIERRPLPGQSGVDIAVALDVSGSMAAEDFHPRNRLEVARRVVASFIRGRPADRIALLAFAGQAETVCPATDDRDSLLALLAGVGEANLPDGTAIGNALATAVARLKDLPGTSKVIVLVTDGGNNAGQIDPETAAGLARAYGIRVHTVAVGRGGRVPITVTVEDPATGRKVRRRIEADVQVDEALLRRISDRTGGTFFRATDSDALRTIFAAIDRMEKSPGLPRFELIRRDLSDFPLLAAAALLGATLLLRAGPLRIATEAA